jgi:hypothetical protein
MLKAELGNWHNAADYQNLYCNTRVLFENRHSGNYCFFHMLFKHVREQNDVNVCVFKQNFNENEQC